MWRDAALVAKRDLLIEARSKVGAGQIVPFAVIVLLLFAFALDPDRGVLARASAGLFWVAVVLSSVLAVQRSFSFESTPAGRDGLRLSGLDPAGIFLGKAGAIVVQLVVLEAILAAGVFFLYDVAIDGAPALVLTSLLATVGIASAGTLYGVLSNGSRARETLLPLLFLPVVAPVLLAAARASDVALGYSAGGITSWVRLLAAFALVYTTVGSVAFGPLLEES